VKNERLAAFGQRRQAEFGGEVVGEHQQGIADAHFDVHELAAGPGRTGDLNGVEGALRKVAVSRGAVDAELRG
jgi:hypothetical protein